MKPTDIAKDNNIQIRLAFELLEIISNIEDGAPIPCCVLTKVKHFMEMRSEFIKSLNIPEKYKID